MSAVDWMQPRNPRAAARAVTTLGGVAVTTTLFTAPLQAQDLRPTEVGVSGALLALVVLTGVAAHRLQDNHRPSHRLAWTAAPVAGVLVLTAVDLLTRDASVTAQIFFVFPVLYGASQLGARGAAVITALAIAGEVAVAAVLLPAGEALVDAWYVAAAVATTAALLTASSERHARLVARLEQMAAVDPLTGLATRRVLDDAAGSAMSGAHGAAGTALILLDVDHFKVINDRYGHPTGDQVLVQLAALLLERSRSTDVVCRLGGDEIAVLLPGCAPGSAVVRAEEILAATRAHTFCGVDGEELAVSISVGCAHLPTHATDLRALYSAADSALYEAKRRGRGRVASIGSVAASP